MKIINPSIELMGNPHMDYVKHIERVGRTCYKSEDRITDESSHKFVETLVNRGHLAMVEHAVFVFEVDPTMFDLYVMNSECVTSLNTRYFNVTITPKPYSSDLRHLISGNARSFYNAFTILPDVYAPFVDVINNICPELFAPILKDDPDIINHNVSRYLFDYNVTLLTYNEIMQLTPEEKDKHLHVTIKFICDTGISHEIVRHRTASFAQESSRYCNYSNDKFGSEITVIEPFFFDKKTKIGLAQYVAWQTACLESERQYMALLDLGAKPEEARDVLPKSLKTEVVMTTNIEGWKHFFKLRCDKAAHPQILELSVPLAELISGLHMDCFPPNE